MAQLMKRKEITFEVKGGAHDHEGKVIKQGETFTSFQELDKLKRFVGKFERRNTETVSVLLDDNGNEVKVFRDEDEELLDEVKARMKANGMKLSQKDIAELFPDASVEIADTDETEVPNVSKAEAKANTVLPKPKPSTEIDENSTVESKEDPGEAFAEQEDTDDDEIDIDEDEDTDEDEEVEVKKTTPKKTPKKKLSLKKK